jgi:glycosyltransferase involved in cell wall biosynthesis
MMAGNATALGLRRPPDGAERPCPAITLVAPGGRSAGGQAVQAAALASHFADEGAEVAFVDSNPALPPGVRLLEHLPYARTLVREAVYLGGLRRIAGERVMIAFSAAHVSFLLGPVPALRAAKRLGLRVILAYHSGEADSHLALWGGIARRWLRRADAIVVPSEYLRGIFERHGIQSVCIPNVVDLSRFRFRVRDPLRPRLVCTRNFEACYRVENVIRAFALVREIRPDATLMLVGSGAEEPALMRLVRRLGPRGIRFAGRVSQSAIPAYLDDADVFVNASIVDNQPVSLLEAFASGLPVVTTAPGGIRDLALDGALARLVRAEDPAELARAVVGTLQTPDRTRRRAELARRQAERYTWPQVRQLWMSAVLGEPS